MISRKAFIVISVVVATAACAFSWGCASFQDVSSNGIKWVGKISGMAHGELKLFVSQMEGEGDFNVRGSLIMDLDKTAGGYGRGRVTGRIKGVVSNGVLQATVSGHATVIEGSSRIKGQMKGILSEEKVSGTWSIGHTEGFHSGKWIAHKAE